MICHRYVIVRSPPEASWCGRPGSAGGAPDHGAQTARHAMVQGRESKRERRKMEENGGNGGNEETTFYGK